MKAIGIDSIRIVENISSCFDVFGTIQGNLLVILVVTFQRRMRSITNFCLANLAVVHFSVGIFCVYQNMYLILGKNWIFGNFPCKMYYFVHEITDTASVLILVVICVERYLSIISPLNSKDWITPHRLWVTMGSVWIGSGIYSCPKLYSSQAMTHDYPMQGVIQTICTPNLGKDKEQIFEIINFGILFLFPLVIITVLYCIIGFALWKNNDYDFVSIGRRKRFGKKLSTFNKTQNCEIEMGEIMNSPTPTSHAHPHPYFSPIPRNHRDHQVSIEPEENPPSRIKSKVMMNKAKSNQQILKTKQNLIRMLIIMVLCFALCHLPYHGRKLWQLFVTNYNGSSVASKIFTVLTFILVYASSSINPFIYLLFSPTFRESCFNTVKCKPRRNRNCPNSPLDSPTIRIIS